MIPGMMVSRDVIISPTAAYELIASNYLWVLYLKYTIPGCYPKVHKSEYLGMGL